MRLALEAALPLAVRFQVAANFAQLAIAVALWLAIVGALVQVYVARVIARRQLAFSYFDRLTGEEMLGRIVEARAFWTFFGWTTFERVGKARRSELLIVPNLIEEIASAYNRKLVDRGLIALVLGPTIEILWDEWQELVTQGQGWRGEWVFYEWSRMQVDTRTRRRREQHKLRRRQSWRSRAFGEEGTTPTIP